MNEKFTLIIVGAFAICYGLVSALRLKSSTGWLSTKGFITKSAKVVEWTEAGKLEDADIAYEYEVGDRKYSSKIIKIGGDMLSNPSKNAQSEADILFNRYPLGKEVDVYVNPKYPKVACLEKSGGEAIFISIFFGILAVIVGLYFEEITDFLF